MENNKKKNNNYYKYHNNHNHYNNKNNKKFYYYNKKKKQNKKDNIIKNSEQQVNNILLDNVVRETNQINNQFDQVQEINQVEEKVLQENQQQEPQQVIKQVIKENSNDYEELEFVPIKKSESNRFSVKGNFFKYALGFVLLVGLVFGVSYSFFTYRAEDSRQGDIAAGEVYVKLVEQSVNLTLNKMYPRTNEEARSRNDNYIDFTVKAKNTSETKEVKYTLNITNGESVQGKTRIDSQYLLIDLEEKVGNEYQYIKEAEPLSTFSFENIVPSNTTSEIEKKYRIRVWVSDAIIISDTEANATYTQVEFANLYANIHIEVNSIDQVPEPSFDEIIAEKAATVNYIASYDDIISGSPNQSFATHDQVSDSATKQTVYYYTGNDAAANSNVLFAGYCWQIVRTTDNGGVRMIYNGVAVNNKCETTRTATKGINGQTGTTQSMSAATLFGRSYDYNLDTGEFTIENSTGLPTSWTTNDNNSNGTKDYKELIGTYTCLSNLDTCSTLYYVGSINQDNTAQAYVAKYTIGDVAHYSQLGTSAFNSNYFSPALVGFMFNTEYDSKFGSKSGEYYTSAAWENGAYVLSNGNGGTAPDATHHYICDSDCTKVRYYYYYISGSHYYYILLENGKTVEDALKEMINYKTNVNDSDENINVYNSSIKGYLENWYKKNLTAYASYLDSATVYCNDRSISNLGAWSAGSIIGYLRFKQNSANKNLNCVNEIDRFAVTNNKAELTYPIGLLTEPERNLMTANFAKTGQYYWGASPIEFSNYAASVRNVTASGDSSYNGVNGSRGARGVVTLLSGTKLEDGTGTYTDPYIVGPLVTRTN